MSDRTPIALFVLSLALASAGCGVQVDEGPLEGSTLAETGQVSAEGRPWRVVCPGETATAIWDCVQPAEVGAGGFFENCMATEIARKWPRTKPKEAEDACATNPDLRADNFCLAALDDLGRCVRREAEAKALDRATCEVPKGRATVRCKEKG
jgi:hypothetical protein